MFTKIMKILISQETRIKEEKEILKIRIYKTK
jgi:hypothetical protein